MIFYFLFFLNMEVIGEISFSPSFDHPFFVLVPQYGHFSARSGMERPHFLQIIQASVSDQKPQNKTAVFTAAQNLSFRT